MTLDLSNNHHIAKKFQLVHQLLDISELDYSYFNFITFSMMIKWPSHSPLFPSPICSVSQQLIEQFILQGFYQSTLLLLSTYLSTFTSILFYTDSSLTNGNSIHIKIGID